LVVVSLTTVQFEPITAGTLPVRCMSQKPRPQYPSTSSILLISTPSFSPWLPRSFLTTQWPVLSRVCTRKNNIGWCYFSVLKSLICVLARYG